MRNKKNFFKKVLVLAMAMIMTMAMGMTALAADNYKIKVTPNNDAAHTYEAYQILKGDISTDGSFVNVAFGDNVTAAGLLTALKASGVKASFESLTDLTVANVLDFLTATSTTPAMVEEFAKAAGNALTGTAKASSSTKTAAGVYELSVSESGYYLVKDKDGSQTDGAYTLNLLKVAGNVEITAKADVPTIEKKIVEGASKVDYNTASIGQAVNYEITSQVPKMEGYTKYFFVVEDTLSEGLTYNGDVAVTIEGKTTPKYTATYDAGKLKVVFNDFYNECNTLAGKKITITYSATLNEKANITDAGNTNTVALTYSNNPNVTTSNTTDEPETGDVTGKTPEQTVKTYTTEIKLTKVDGTDNSKTLKGAKFKIAGTSYVASLINGEVYKASASGTYYMLKDGTYTTDGSQDAAKYDSTTTKYEKVTVIDKDTTASELNAEAYVDANGVITFKGLGAGTYTITELVAPDGYNLLTDAINITLSESVDDATGVCTWTATGVSATIANDVISFTVENNKGITLPSTGGIGTTIFYVVGGILVLGAAVLLVTRKRMSSEEK